MYNQLKYFARDTNNQLISGNCIFCTLNNIYDLSEESYLHLFLEADEALAPIATQHNIERPVMEEEGEKVLYLNMHVGKRN